MSFHYVFILVAIWFEFNFYPCNCGVLFFLCWNSKELHMLLGMITGMMLLKEDFEFECHVSDCCIWWCADCWPVNYLIVALLNPRWISKPHPIACATLGEMKKLTVHVLPVQMLIVIWYVHCGVFNKTLKAKPATFCGAEAWQPSYYGASGVGQFWWHGGDAVVRPEPEFEVWTEPNILKETKKQCFVGLAKLQFCKRRSRQAWVCCCKQHKQQARWM